MRIIDILAALFGLIILSPVLVTLALIVKITSSGPVFYRAHRIGRYGDHFRLYKFRSMVVDADQKGPGITTNGDARVTPFGNILRRYKLDELPQLINVLAGDMSLVGPRPEDPRYVKLYTQEQAQVLEVRPGITSVASLRYHDEEQLLSGSNWEEQYIKRVLPDKLSLELNYLAKRNIWTDIGIIVRTVKTIIVH